MIAPSEILFPDGIKRIDMLALSKAIGCNRSTLYKWKADPDMIRFGDLKAMVRVNQLTNEQILMLFGRRAR